MRRYGFYHRETGVVHAQSYSTNAEGVRLKLALAANTPADHVAIEGTVDPFSQHVDVATGLVVDHQPPQPSVDHEWNNGTKRWEPTAAAQELEDRRRAARREIQQLHAQQHDWVRKFLLGRGGEAELQAIDDRITELEKLL